MEANLSRFPAALEVMEVFRGVTPTWIAISQLPQGWPAIHLHRFHRSLPMKENDDLKGMNIMGNMSVSRGPVNASMGPSIHGSARGDAEVTFQDAEALLLQVIGDLGAMPDRERAYLSAGRRSGCPAREKTAEALANRGWCYGRESDEAAYQAEWHECTADSLR